MAPKETETCGRCSMTSVVEATAGDAGDDRDPFGDARIEVPESEMRVVAKPQLLAGRTKRKLDELAARLTYGR